MSAVLAIALKDLRTFTRTRSALFFTFIWPLCVAVIFGTLFGGSNQPGPKLPIAVVDEDGSAGSRAFAERLLTRDSFVAVRATRAEALEAVRKGQRTAAVILRPGFGVASQQLFAGTPPEVQVYTDPSRQAERGMLEGLLLQQGAERMQALFANPAGSQQSVRDTLSQLRASQPGQQPALEAFLGQLDTFLGTPDARSGPAGTPGAAGSTVAWQPLTVTMESVQRQRTGPRNGYDVTFPQAMLWGIFGCVMTFSTTFVSERVRGTLLRLQVSPLSRSAILAGKSLAALLAIFLVECFVLAVGVTFFGVRPGSWPLLLAAIACASAAFVGIILLLASLARTEHGIGGAGPAVMMPMFLLGGAMIPLMVMPPGMVQLSSISPVKWAIVAFEGAIWRDFSVVEMVTPCAILLAVAAATFALGVRRQRG